MRSHTPQPWSTIAGVAGNMLAMLVCSLSEAGAQVTRGARSVRIVGTDYAFSAPDTVAAGPTAFHFENRGARQHEVAVVLMRRDAKPAEIIATAKRGLPTPKLGEAYGDGPPLGALFAAPGQASRTTLVSSLEKGRTYVIVCTFRDTPTTPEHAELGMFHLIHVR